MTGMYSFLSGAAMMGAFVGGLFFLRFWRKTQDRLFLIFAISFFLMGLERMALAIRENDGENNVMLYLMRLSSFFLILYGIWDKNRPTTK
jgi:hypothetical protein